MRILVFDGLLIVAAPVNQYLWSSVIKCDPSAITASDVQSKLKNTFFPFVFHCIYF